MAYKKFFMSTNKANARKRCYKNAPDGTVKVDVAASVEQFLANGGKIQQVPPRDGKFNPFTPQKQLSCWAEKGFNGLGLSKGSSLNRDMRKSAKDE